MSCGCVRPLALARLSVCCSPVLRLSDGFGGCRVLIPTNLIGYCKRLKGSAHGWRVGLFAFVRRSISCGFGLPCWLTPAPCRRYSSGGVSVLSGSVAMSVLWCACVPLGFVCISSRSETLQAPPAIVCPFLSTNAETYTTPQASAILIKSACVSPVFFCVSA